eukprot:1862599-Heterocapsa_arctica.AAC.1
MFQRCMLSHAVTTPRSTLTHRCMLYATPRSTLTPGCRGQSQNISTGRIAAGYPRSLRTTMCDCLARPLFNVAFCDRLLALYS